MGIRPSKLIFNATKAKKEIERNVFQEQTLRLTAYAEEQIGKIAEKILSCATRNNLDRTGNLLDSLVWGVYFNGALKKNGYYRKNTAIEDSYLHEYSTDQRETVNGYSLAQTFIAQYSPKETNGWEVVWAICAPYWGYWEKGFEHVFSNIRFQFSVMSQRYDVIRKQLKPAKVSFHTYVPKYGKSSKKKSNK